MKINFRFEGERDSENKQYLQEAIEFILEKNYGETLLHEELSRILHVNLEDELMQKRYKYLMNRIKNFILQYGYVLKSIQNVGYYILKPSQISKHCFRTYIRRSTKLFNKSDFILEHTEKFDLDDDRLEEINNLMDLNKQLIEKTEKMIEESAYYSRKLYYDSLED